MENQNVNETNYKDLTDEQKELIRNMVLDLVFTAFRHINWDETVADFTDHHTPEEYGADGDTLAALLNSITSEMDGNYDEAVNELRTDGYYSDLFAATLDAVFTHEDEPSAEPEKLN